MSYLLRLQKAIVVSLVAVASLASGNAQRLQPPEREKPDLVIQNGHTDNVRALAFSPDGTLLRSEEHTSELQSQR